mmetsp:Transcript_19851/g.27944  ORF Transcript_19851/g.27944 Transcript_19851/m.27944 type:complete len:344 (-) Transcript_19851:391-1422(-)|eukprot:CAMPEP_0185253214 /NCGR_PEP_ID=MMETSP1359-20130426/2061_1 /TAXON_ID=552665 /ORGANISM="Bigelowiella longifila, Strain CCMP242" /LENGTH=343 /DNA_ID=CAMNT_0027835557 /DNA_START=113 /DNA_END=1144 /DNA_ORIENTATION=-
MKPDSSSSSKIFPPQRNEGKEVGSNKRKHVESAEEGRARKKAAKAAARGTAALSALGLGTYGGSDDDEASEDDNNGVGGLGLLSYDFEKEDEKDDEEEKVGDDPDVFDITKSKFRHLLELNLLPPEPTGPVEPGIQQIVEKHVNTAVSNKKDKKNKNNAENKRPSVNESLRSLKGFHNPYILQKVAEEFKIYPTGSNYPRHLFDPRSIPVGDFYEEVSKAQKAYEAQKASSSHAQQQQQQQQKQQKQGSQSKPIPGGLVRNHSDSSVALLSAQARVVAARNSAAVAGLAFQRARSVAQAVAQKVGSVGGVPIIAQNPVITNPKLQSMIAQIQLQVNRKNKGGI